ncbi:MAG: hypothetical protein AAF962_03970 [Actinomycetota bacterium]
MGRSSPELDVELLDSTVAPAASEYQRVGTSPPRSLSALLAVAFLAVGVWLIGSGPDAPPEVPAPTTVPPQPTPDAAVLPAPVGVEPDLAPAAAPVLNAVVSSPTGGGTLLVTMADNGSSEVSDLPNLARFAFDTSGQWIAGISMGTLGERPETLWVGRVGTPMEPVAVDIASYSWHDERPGELAWTQDDDRSQVYTLSLNGGIDTEVERNQLETEGRLRGWGDWGYAVETWTRGRVTAVLDAEGLVLQELVGRYRGRLADGDLIFSGGSSAPLRFSPSTGSLTTVPWLKGEDDVSSLVITPDGTSTVAFISRGGLLSEPMTGEVVVVSADEAVTVGHLSGFTTIALGADGAILLVEQYAGGDTAEPAQFTVLVDGATDWASPVPDVFQGREWVVALAVA